MAITTGDCLLWRTLRQMDAIPARPRVLELGRANWYGDIGAAAMNADLRAFSDPDDPWLPPAGKLNPFSVADCYYHALLRHPERLAIDLDPGASGALRLDLNLPLPDPFWDAFDIVINTGTLEHVFDQRQAWQTAHDACKPGGLMVHALPLWGWIDHGFYCHQPTLVADLATANGYDILAWIYAEMQPSSALLVQSGADILSISKSRSQERPAMQHVAFRRPIAQPFRVPRQGVYADPPAAG
jgi:SAM-dependent methyltransferase